MVKFGFLSSTGIFIISLIGIALLILSLIAFYHLSKISENGEGGAIYSRGKSFFEKFIEKEIGEEVEVEVEEEELVEEEVVVEEEEVIVEEEEDEDKYYMVEEEKEKKTGTSGILLYSDSPNKVKQILSFLDFHKTKEKNSPVSDHIQLIGNYNAKDEEIIYFMQKELLDKFARFLLDTTARDCIVFFDQHNFKGRSFLIPIGEGTLGELETEETGGEKLYVVRKKWESTSMNVESNRHPSDTPQFGERDTIPDLGEFVRLFRFYYNRPFSCAIPEDTIVRITPFKRDNSNDEAISIEYGLHRQLTYPLPIVRKIEILTKEK